LVTHPVRLGAGSTIDRYEVVRTIASGGGGMVFEAIDTSLRRRVALKVLHASAVGSPEAKRAAARFLREARIAAQIRHPHVVDVLDVGMSEGVPFLVMELVEGETLEQQVSREKRLSVARTVEIVLPLLSAVAELHDNGIVHRDLKPANVLMGSGPALWPKLADFGVSCWDGDSASITHPGAMIGTPEYLAPELIRDGGRGTERSDLYALGVLLYECTTGRRPFVGPTMYERLHAAVSADLEPPSARVPSLPAGFDAVVLRALHRDPAQRFASVRELAEALLPFAAGAVAARWRDEFAPLESVTVGPDPGFRAFETVEVRRDARGENREALIETYDGVAVSTRGDALIMVWKASARLARTRWAFDRIDRFAAEQDGSFLVFMILLPSADPPDGPARLENDKRIRPIAHRVRRLATVVAGDGVWQVLIRSVIRAMVLPHRALASGGTAIDVTVEAGIGALLRAAGPRTPSFDRLFDDVQGLYTALGEDPPVRDDARRSRSGVHLRSMRSPRKSA
jgi:hypothetical protein